MLWLLGALVMAGCVPIPQPHEVVGGRRITREDAAFITRGVTSRREVIGTFGAPTVDLPDLRMLAYVWIEGKEAWITIFGSTRRTADWTLLVALDENDRVTHWGFDRRRWADTVISQARKWAEEQQVRLPLVRTSFDPVPVPDGMAAVYVFRVQPPVSSSSFLPVRSFGAPVAVAVDGQYVTEMHDRTYIALLVTPGRRAIVADPLPPYRYVERGTAAIPPSRRRPATITLEVSAGQQHFLELLSVAAEHSLDTSLTPRKESEAKPTLQTLRPVW